MSALNTNFGSYPPDDVNFRQDLMEAVIGDWDIEVQGRERHFRVTYSNTLDEDYADRYGQHYQDTNIEGGHLPIPKYYTISHIISSTLFISHHSNELRFYFVIIRLCLLTSQLS